MQAGIREHPMTERLKLPWEPGGKNITVNLIMMAMLVGLAGTWISGGMNWHPFIAEQCTYSTTVLGKLGTPTAIRTSTPVPTALDPARVDALADDLKAFYAYASCGNQRYHGLSVAATLTTLAFTFLTTISSSLEWKTRGIIFGAVATVLVALNTAFPLGQQAQSYQEMAVRTDKLMSDTRFGINEDPAEFEKVRAAFQQLKLDSARLERGAIVPTPTETATPTMSPSAQQTPTPSPASSP